MISNKMARCVLVPVGSALLFAQCDVLDTQPFGSLNTGTFYKSASDFDAATIGAYSTVANLTWSGRDQSLYEQGLLPDDDTRGPGGDEDSDFAWTAQNNSVYMVWYESYKGVMRANLILEQLETATQLTDAQKARYAGEAKFVRAFFNFMLARYFGNPPVVTTYAKTVEETRPGMSAPHEIWDLIEQDLTDAAAGLNGLNLAAGRASRAAALGLLGKVQVFRAQWGQGNPAILNGTSPQAKYQQAVTNLEAVVNGSGKSLVDNFGDNFRYTTENNEESLFELQASFGTDINGWAAVDQNGGGASSGTGRQLATGAAGYNGNNAPGGFDWGDGGIIMTRTGVDAFEKYDSAMVEVMGRPVKVVVRDPRAYFTFYSSGQQFGRGCSGQPVPYNFRWNCSGPDGSVAVQDTGRWSLTAHTPAKYNRPYENFSGGRMLNQSVDQNNERYLRLADVMLLLAEARLLGNGDVAGAAALVNQVRERARGSWDAAYGAGTTDAALYAGFDEPANLLPARPSNVSPAQMHEWIRHERRVELMLEFHRYDDLVRWLRAGLITRAQIDFGDEFANAGFRENTHLLRPIPSSEIRLNDLLEQNPGYN